MARKTHKISTKVRKNSNNKTKRGGAIFGYENKDFTQELAILTANCEGEGPAQKAGRQQLIKDNLIFVALVLAAVASKNKLDFPPAGPRSPDKVAYQDKRIRLLLQAISEYTDTSAGAGTGTDTQILGKWGITQQAWINTRVAASKGLRSGQAVANTDFNGDRNKVYPAPVGQQQALPVGQQQALPVNQAPQPKGWF